MPRVVVVGAGVVGSSIAYRLAEAGATVQLVDRNQPGSGTTAASFAWVNANQKTPRDYFELNLAGVREHYRLRDELGDAPWLHPNGNLIWSDDADELEARVGRLRDWGYAAEWRTGAQVRAELEPKLRVGPTVRLAYFPDEAWVDAPRLAATLIDRGRALGLQTRFGDGLEAIETAGGRLTGARLASGEVIPADALVNAAGPGADTVARLAGTPLPLAPTRGLLVRLPVDGTLLGRVVHTPQVNLRPDGDGFLLAHHDSIDLQLDDRAAVELNDPLVAELRARAEAVLDGLGGSPAAAAHVGVRSIPADGRSALGAVSALPGYYEAVTHSGVTLGPLLGRLLTQELLSGEIDPLAAPFRADRFRQR